MRRQAVAEERLLRGGAAEEVDPCQLARPEACDAPELASRCRADAGVEGELIHLDERDEYHRAGDLPEREAVAAVQVEGDAALTELRVDEREDVGRGAHGENVPVRDGHVEPRHRLLDDEGVDQEVEDRVRDHEDEVASPVRRGERARDAAHGDAPEEEGEDGERDRPGRGPLERLQADGSSFSNWRMPSSAKRSRTYGERRPRRFTLGTIFENSIFRNSCICGERRTISRTSSTGQPITSHTSSMRSRSRMSRQPS